MTIITFLVINGFCTLKQYPSLTWIFYQLYYTTIYIYDLIITLLWNQCGNQKKIEIYGKTCCIQALGKVLFCYLSTIYRSIILPIWLQNLRRFGRRTCDVSLFRLRNALGCLLRGPCPGVSRTVFIVYNDFVFAAVSKLVASGAPGSSRSAFSLCHH